MNYLQLLMIYKDHPIIKDSLIAPKQLEAQVIQIYNDLKRKVERSDIRFYQVDYSLIHLFQYKPDFDKPVKIRGLEKLNTERSVLNKSVRGYIYYTDVLGFELGINIVMSNRVNS